MLELVKKLRKELGDEEEPFLHTDDELVEKLTEAVFDYSRYRPRKRKGSLMLMPGQKEYNLPEDYQTWIEGLTGYEILDRALFLTSSPFSSTELSFLYLADHSLESIPTRDHGLLLDFCMAKALDEIVREGSEISALKLGKGLQISFDNFDKIVQEAAVRRNRYDQSVKKPVGMWM